MDKIRSRVWFFTLNNYVENDINMLKEKFKDIIFQEERGGKGTPHLQGVIRVHSVCSGLTMSNNLCKLLGHRNTHLEKCGNIIKARNYCKKRDSRIPGTEPIIQGYFKDFNKETNSAPAVLVLDDFDTDNLSYYPWQNELLKIFEQKPDRRTVLWFYDTIGNSGKTTFARHLYLKKNALYVSGKNSDIKYCIAETIEEKKTLPEIIVIDLPRSEYDNVDYVALEKIKDGIFFNTKYKSKTVLLNKVHLLVFANQPPKTNALSHDRWYIKEIDKETLSITNSEYKGLFSDCEEKNDELWDMDEEDFTYDEWQKIEEVRTLSAYEKELMEQAYLQEQQRLVDERDIYLQGLIDKNNKSNNPSNKNSNPLNE